MKNLLFVVALAVIPSLSFAQSQTEEEDINFYLGINSGTLSPTEEDSLDSAGFAFGASATAVFGGWFGVGVSYLGSANGDTILGSSTTFHSGSADVKLMVPIQIYDNEELYIRPYARAGVGLYQLKAEVDGTTQETGVNAQVPLGAGVLVDINEELALGAEFTYHILVDAQLDQEPQIDELDAWEASLNLAFKL